MSKKFRVQVEFITSIDIEADSGEEAQNIMREMLSVEVREHPTFNLINYYPVMADEIEEDNAEL